MSAQPPSRRSVTLATKVTRDEAAILAQNASVAGVTMSAYLRQAGIAGKIEPRAIIPEVNQAQWADLGRVGSNLNQIAARLNDGGQVDASVPAAIEDTRILLSAVRSALIGVEVPNGG